MARMFPQTTRIRNLKFKMNVLFWKKNPLNQEGISAEANPASSCSASVLLRVVEFTCDIKGYK